MQKKFFLRPWFLVIFGCLFIFFVTIFGAAMWLYNGIFRVPLSQVKSDLSNKISSCETINKCALRPGDILIRRYMTQRIQYIDKPLRIFFTHAALYLGDGKLFEVFGPEKNPIDDVQILDFSKSDWLYSDVNNFVIIRPKNYAQAFDKIKKDLEFVAAGSNYRFGPSFLKSNYTTCAEIIFYELNKNGVVRAKDVPRIVTPDYLFWFAINNPDEFEIVGFNIQS